MTILLPNSQQASTQRETFLKVLFDSVPTGLDAVLCIARRAAGRGAFDQQFFQWPEGLPDALEYITESVVGYDLYFSPMLYDTPLRTKEHVACCPVVWADLDECDPSLVLIPPTTTIQSSPGRWQAYWITPGPMAPDDAESMARRIAYFHAEDGADRSGWDLTQLMRIPWTMNFKTSPPHMVMVTAIGDYPTLEALDAAYPAFDTYEQSAWDFPESIPDAVGTLRRHEIHLRSQVWDLFQNEPDHDWSSKLWNLEMLLCEAGLTREEVFAVARESACNKYRRDGRDDKALWAEVCKAWAQTRDDTSAVINDVAAAAKLPDIISDEDIAASSSDRTFIEDFIDFGKIATDADPRYHEIGAFMVLSSILSANLHISVSFGRIPLNIWGMLLGDTTLTRKTTAMQLATNLVKDVAPEALLATDGSIEGIFTAMGQRTGVPSLMVVDEFSGMLSSMAKRDYYTGMSEMMTKLYDGTTLRRLLRKETINIDEPIFLFFAGGIKDRVQRLLTTDHVGSGFLSRFVLIKGEVDMDRLRPMDKSGPKGIDERNDLLNRLRDMKERYIKTFSVRANGTRAVVENRPEVIFSDDAWNLYNQLEMRLIRSVMDHPNQEVLIPMMDRLAKTGLKGSALIAASRMDHDHVAVEERDVVKAFSYVNDWREQSIDIVSNIGIDDAEHRIQLALGAIRRKPNGIQRGEVMRNYNLKARDAEMIFDTLLQRGLIRRERSGRGEKLFAVEVREA